MIRTVLGDIPAANAGHCQCHEHIWLKKCRSFEINPSLWMEDEKLSLMELNRYRQKGGGLIVDAQPGFSGRVAAKLMELSEKSGVHIVATTGFHREQFYYDDSPMMKAGEDELANLFISELTEGMVEDDFSRAKGKCGILKGALESGGVACDKWNQVRFNALMEAARNVPAPLMFHTEKGADLEKFLHFLTDNGIDLDRVILCHLDRTHHDPALHKMLLQAGVRMNYDSICRLKYLCNAKETALIAMMCEEGFASRITLSLDTTRARLEAYHGELGLDYILTTFIGLLKERGISDADILKMTKTNGQDALAFGKGN